MRVVTVAAGIGLAFIAACASVQRTPLEIEMPPPTLPVEQLLQDLASPEGPTRAAAAWQLAGVREPPPEARLALELLRTDPDRTVRYAVAWALEQLPGATLAQPTTDVDVARPKLKHQTRPKYTRAAFAAKLEGTVVIDFLIGEEGEVAHLEVRRSIPELDAAALACVRQWRFEPMRIGGLPRATVASAPITFRIY